MSSLNRTAALTVAATTGIIGVSFGALAVAAGIAPVVACAMSLVVFAGGAQLAATSVLGSGGSPVAAVASALLLNSRYVGFGLAVAPRFAGVSPRMRAVAAHLLIDESGALALAERDPQQAQAAFWTSGVAVFVLWNLGTAIGAFAGSALGDPAVLGLDAACPAAILALLVPQLAGRRARVAALVGGGVALAASLVLPPGLPVLCAIAAPILARWVPEARAAAEGGAS